MMISVPKDGLLVENASRSYKEGMKVLSKAKLVDIDCSNVEEIDSTGIAVLCAWWQYASVHNVVCNFKVNAAVQDAMLRNGIELP